jgi:hypothetical protein
MEEAVVMNRVISENIFSEQTQYLADQRLVELRGWIIHQISYPVIDITFNKEGRAGFRVRLLCQDWDGKPPSVELLSVDGNYLIRLPQGSGVLNSGHHLITRRPFICSPGSLEYHTHPSHIADRWENYKNRSGFDLGGIISQIWSAWGITHD